MTVVLLSYRYRKQHRQTQTRKDPEVGKMKNKFRHKAVAFILAAMMTATPVCGTVFAADEVISDQPERPVAESYEDNDKIEEYNKKVDEYNEAAKAHNESVDKEYEAAVAETEKKNAEIDQHNEAETERVKAAEERNAQAVKDAEEENARIDEENAAEEARVTEHNSSEDEKAKASAEARKAAEEENEAINAHNEAVAKYAEDKVQYDADYTKYQKDLAMEQKIKAAGYASVEQYNDMINTYYNEPAKASVKKNASAKTVSANDTYTVAEAAEKAGASVNVHIEHVFEGTDVSYIEDFEIDRNDVITINSIAALGNATTPGNASLYYNTDEAHSMGYWVPYVEFQYNARYVNSTWNCGTSYEVSYKDGKNHKYDSEDIIAVYTYIWVPQKTYKTYDVPAAPAELEDPGEARELVEVPELYTPNYQEFVQKQHVEAEIEEIEEANILEHIANPVKRAYIALLSHMALFDVPAAEAAEEAALAETTEIRAEEVIPAAAATAKAKKAAKAAEATADADTADIEDVVVIGDTEAPRAATAAIEDNDTPLADSPAWALINLIMTIVTGLISAVLLAGWHRRKDEEADDNEDSSRRSRLARLFSLIPAAGAVTAFILTENMSDPMVLTDKWTVLMAVILMIQAAIAMMAKKRNNEEDDSESAEAITA